MLIIKNMLNNNIDKKIIKNVYIGQLKIIQLKKKS